MQSDMCKRIMAGLSAVAITGGLALASAAPASAAAGLQNGGFEDPAISPNAYRTVLAGESVGAWQVTNGSVDLIQTKLYQAAEGEQSLDLNGEEPGTVQQNLSTLPLLSYKVSFSLAGDPNTQREVAGQVLANGTVIKDFAFDTTGKSYDNMGWTTVTATFQATGTSTPLAFRGTTPTGAAGAMIDNVRIQKCLLVLCLPSNFKTNKHGK
jgi:choice-of-anchor C domain-containing protein